MAKRLRSWIPRSVKLVPAAMISAIVVAVMGLLGLLNFNLGSRSGSDQTLTSDTPAEHREAADPTAGESDAAPETSPGGGTGEDSDRPAELANPTELADVLIDGDQYQLALRDPGRESVDQGSETVRERRTLEEIVELARELPGDAAGVRVRISRRFNATARADRALREALLEAGLTEDEIDHRRTLVD